MSERRVERIFRGANVPWALLYLYCAFVNLNDPDPLFWAAAYVVAAAMCLTAAAGRMPGAPMLAYGVMCSAMSIWIAATGIDESHPMKGFPQLGIFREEVVREALGLALIAFWLGFAGWWLVRRQRPDPEPSV